MHDADLDYSPEEYPLLMEPVVSEKADAVFGSRFMVGVSRKSPPSWRAWAAVSAKWASLQWPNLRPRQKVNWRDGVRAIYAMVTYDFVRRMG